MRTSIFLALASVGLLTTLPATLAAERRVIGAIVAIGLTVTMLVTAYLHLGVVTGLLPTTGLTLPFMSYGRSNLILSMLATGILVNIGSARERIVGIGATNPLAGAPRRG